MKEAHNLMKLWKYNKFTGEWDMYNGKKVKGKSASEKIEMLEKLYPTDRFATSNVRPGKDK